MASPVTVRPLRAVDGETLARLRTRIWGETYAGLVDAGVLGALTDDVEAWTERGRAHEREGRSPEGATTWVARAERVPVGWASVGPPRDDPAPAPVELWALYVAPEHQGGGAADQLIEAALPQGAAYLWVLAGNARAVAFYRRHGFTLDGVAQPVPEWGATDLRMTR